jgi:hypothetical protein
VTDRRAQCVGLSVASASPSPAAAPHHLHLRLARPPAARNRDLDLRRAVLATGGPPGSPRPSRCRAPPRGKADCTLSPTKVWRLSSAAVARADHANLGMDRGQRRALPLCPDDAAGDARARCAIRPPHPSATVPGSMPITRRAGAPASAPAVALPGPDLSLRDDRNHPSSPRAVSVPARGQAALKRSSSSCEMSMFDATS